MKLLEYNATTGRIDEWRVERTLGAGDLARPALLRVWQQGLHYIAWEATVLRGAQGDTWAERDRVGGQVSIGVDPALTRKEAMRRADVGARTLYRLSLDGPTLPEDNPDLAWSSLDEIGRTLGAKDGETPLEAARRVKAALSDAESDRDNHVCYEPSVLDAIDNRGLDIVDAIVVRVGEAEADPHTAPFPSHDYAVIRVHYEGAAELGRNLGKRVQVLSPRDHGTLV